MLGKVRLADFYYILYTILKGSCKYGMLGEVRLAADQRGCAVASIRGQALTLRRRLEGVEGGKRSEGGLDTACGVARRRVHAAGPLRNAYCALRWSSKRRERRRGVGARVRM